MSKRLDYIDIAKGLCIVLVVMGHIIQFDLEGNAAGSVMGFIYSFHMPVFMLLAGYVAALSRSRNTLSTAKSFVVKKFTQLFVPFLVWGVVITPFVLNGADYSSFFYKAKEILLHPVLGAWFCAVLFVIQIVFFVICVVANKMKFGSDILKDLSACILVLPFVLAVSFYMKKMDISGGVNIYVSVKYILSFSLGYFLSKYFQKILFNKAVALVCVPLLCLVSRYFVMGKTPEYMHLLISIPAAVVVLNVARYLETFKDSFWMKQTIAYGKNSLIIYLTHFAIVRMMHTDSFLSTDHINSIPLFCLLLPISVVVCWLCVSLGKCVSFNSFLSKLLYGK